MKKLILSGLILLSFNAIAQNNNYNDDLDVNTVPAPLEERENEVVNRSDLEDTNAVPASMEPREEQEEVESDVLPVDDPERGWDPADQELDEQEAVESAEGAVEEIY